MFKFGLESLLKQRQLTAEKLQKELSGLQRELLREERKRDDCDLRQHQLQTERGRRQRRGLSAAEHQLFCQFSDHLNLRRQRQTLRIEQVETRLNQKRNELIGAMKACKILEKLKEKHYADHCRQERKQEQDFINEIAMCQFNRARWHHGITEKTEDV